MPALCAEPVFSDAASSDESTSLQCRPCGCVVLSRAARHQCLHADINGIGIFYTTGGPDARHEIGAIDRFHHYVRGQARGPDRTLPRSGSDHEADAQHEVSSQPARPRRCDGLHCRCCDKWPDRYWLLVRAGFRDGGAVYAHASNSQTSFRRRNGGSPGAPCQFGIGPPHGVKPSRRSRRPHCRHVVAKVTGAGVALHSHLEIVRDTNRWLLPDLMRDDDSDDGTCIDD